MSVDEQAPIVGPPPGGIAPDLLGEATRQLNICNACRYCEGICAVFPALSRRNLLDTGDVSHLANLCHDCRSCFDACMYATPHEFEINVPKVMSAVRVEDYRRYVWPRRVPRLFSGWPGVFSGAVIATVVVFAAAVLNTGFAGLLTRDGGPASPYDLIPYAALLTMLLLTSAFAVVVTLAAAWRFWTETNGRRDRIGVRAVLRAAWQAATLRYLRGGGQNCHYPDDTRPSPARRHLHALVAYGFGLCFVSTISASVMQELLGADPPYPMLSVPVLTGLAGGVAMTAGCVALLRLKARSSRVTSFAQMTVKDYGLLVALAFLGLSGLATLFTRDTPAFGIVYLVHLASVLLAFAAAPYSKFVHLV